MLAPRPGEPQVDRIEEMKTREVDHSVGSGFLPCAEENRSSEDVLEAFDDAPMLCQNCAKIQLVWCDCARTRRMFVRLSVELDQGFAHHHELRWL